MIIQVKNITKKYQRHDEAINAVDNLSLDIPKGSFVRYCITSWNIYEEMKRKPLCDGMMLAIICMQSGMAVNN